ncbi:hypothetical protein JCM13591A_35680 [Microbacterium xylanilyticum]
MHHGVPELRGPAWWDPYRDWHRPRTRTGDPHRIHSDLTHAGAPPGRPSSG